MNSVWCDTSAPCDCYDEMCKSDMNHSSVVLAIVGQSTQRSVAARTEEVFVDEPRHSIIPNKSIWMQYDVLNQYHVIVTMEFVNLIWTIPSSIGHGGSIDPALCRSKSPKKSLLMKQDIPSFQTNQFGCSMMWCNSKRCLLWWNM